MAWVVGGLGTAGGVAHADQQDASIVKMPASRKHNARDGLMNQHYGDRVRGIEFPVRIGQHLTRHHRPPPSAPGSPSICITGAGLELAARLAIGGHPLRFPR